MFHFKGCPKCSGDLFFEEDFYGSYFRCLQCGLNVDVEILGPERNKTPEENVEPVAELVA